MGITHFRNILLSCVLVGLTAFLSIVIAGPSHAATITFNGTAADFGVSAIVSTYTEGGFNFDETAGMINFVDNDFLSPSILAFDDDVLEFELGSSARVTVAGGGAFTATSLRMGGVNLNFPTPALEFIGTKSGGGGWCHKPLHQRQGILTSFRFSDSQTSCHWT